MAHRRFHEYQSRVDEQMRDFVTGLVGQRDERATELHKQEEHAALVAGMLSDRKADQQRELFQDIKDLSEQVERFKQMEQEAALERQGMQLASYAQDQQDTAQKLAAIQQELAKKEQAFVAALVRAEAQDRANYRTYWESRLAMAQSHLDSMAVNIDPVVKGLLHDLGLDHLTGGLSGVPAIKIR